MNTQDRIEMWVNEMMDAGETSVFWVAGAVIILAIAGIANLSLKIG